MENSQNNQSVKDQLKNLSPQEKARLNLQRNQNLKKQKPQDQK